MCQTKSSYGSGCEAETTNTSKITQMTHNHWIIRGMSENMFFISGEMTLKMRRMLSDVSGAQPEDSRLGFDPLVCVCVLAFCVCR